MAGIADASQYGFFSRGGGGVALGEDFGELGGSLEENDDLLENQSSTGQGGALEGEDFFDQLAREARAEEERERQQQQLRQMQQLQQIQQQQQQQAAMSQTQQAAQAPRVRSDDLGMASMFLQQAQQQQQQQFTAPSTRIAEFDLASIQLPTHDPVQQQKPPPPLPGFFQQHQQLPPPQQQIQQQQQQQQQQPPIPPHHQQLQQQQPGMPPLPGFFQQPPPQQQQQPGMPPPPPPGFFQQQQQQPPPGMPPMQQPQQQPMTLAQLEARMNTSARIGDYPPQQQPHMMTPQQQQQQQQQLQQPPPATGWGTIPANQQLQAPKAPKSLLQIQQEQQQQQKVEQRAQQAAHASQHMLAGGGAVPAMGQGGIMRHETRHSVGQQHNKMTWQQRGEAPPGMRQPRGAGGPSPPARRRVRESRWMSVEELEQILRIGWAATHTQTPYVEDYVSCALCEKYGKPYYINSRVIPFLPDTLRSSLPGSIANKGEVMYLELEGMGKVPVANIKTPKPIMDLVMSGGGGDEGGATGSRSLLKDPLVAVRKMVEDGFQLCQDVEDVDRTLRGSNQPPETAEKLVRRRALLLEGLVASMMLSDEPRPPAKPSDGSGVAFDKDIYFAKLTSIPKGTRLMAKCISLAPRGSPACRKLVYATLRHCRRLGMPKPPAAGSDAEAGRRYGELRAASGMLVAGVVAAVMAFDADVIANCLCALAKGDLFTSSEPLPTPLDPPPLPGRASPPGAGVLLAAVCGRASQVGLMGGSSPAPVSESSLSLYRESFTKLEPLLNA